MKKGTLGEGMPPKSNSEWKAWRIQLASSNPGLNKAGRPYGKGTTSKARARRGRASEEEEEDPPYTPSNHDWGDGWGDGWGGGWGESSWQPWSGEVPWSWRDQDWWVEEGQEREEVRLQSAMRSPSNSPCARGRKGTQEGGAGAAAAPHPLAGTGILPGVSLQGAGCQGCR